MKSQKQTLTRADWQDLYDNKAALVKSPEAHQFALDELAGALHAQGVIDDAQLADQPSRLTRLTSGAWRSS
ncbi:MULTISPECIES: hypothetical protein [unclassified Pseudomonas]|uniref:hypothetical protein n=1 Tax=unclassified Pseudomonas TaxID=196821 RepID=UPI001F5AB609|nr:MULTISPECIES: hypothetical protein [unclassified Pseudomonas]